MGFNMTRLKEHKDMLDRVKTDHQPFILITKDGTIYHPISIDSMTELDENGNPDENKITLTILSIEKEPSDYNREMTKNYYVNKTKEEEC